MTYPEFEAQTIMQWVNFLDENGQKTQNWFSLKEQFGSKQDAYQYLQPYAWDQCLYI